MAFVWKRSEVACRPRTGFRDGTRGARQKGFQFWPPFSLSLLRSSPGVRRSAPPWIHIGSFMKPIFTLFFCLMTMSAFTEVINNIEYHLPESAKEWEMTNKLESKRGTVLIYTPKGVERQNAKEFFGVYTSPTPFDINDASSMKAHMAAMLPGMTVDVQVLEKSHNTFLYEWSAQENTQEKTHGWGHAFGTKEGSALLCYQTENIADLEQARFIWLPALKNAHNK
jgi:hypothetical protein